MSNEKLITSVLGFNFNIDITYKDSDGTDKPIATTCHTVEYTGEEKARVGTNMCPEEYFTNFNYELLRKIKDYQRRNF